MEVGEGWGRAGEGRGRGGGALLTEGQELEELLLVDTRRRRSLSNVRRRRGEVVGLRGGLRAGLRHGRAWGSGS